MARNTNLDDVLFPVGFTDVFIEGMTDGTNKSVKIPVDRYHAIINQDTGDVLCVVTKDYKLITNEEAVELGKECYKKIFNVSDTDDFEIFNITTSSTKTICYIDVIHKNYPINIWKQDVYLPYIRITNSYNRTRALSFDLGFCRKLCDNGVIFEKDTVNFTLYHTKQIIKDNVEFNIQSNKLEKLKNKFIEYSKNLSECYVPEELAIPLMCKAMDIKFNSKKKGPEFERESRRRKEFMDRAGFLAKEYFGQLGKNVYSIFNACTDYATHSKSGEENYFADVLQKRIGNWVESFAVERAKDKFTLLKHIGKYASVLTWPNRSERSIDTGELLR